MATRLKQGRQLSLSWGRYSAITIVSLVVLLVYFPVLSHGFIDWDDYTLILSNPLIQGFSPAIFWSFDPELYIPLTLLSFQIEHALFGFNPFVFHLTNLVLHGANSCLIVVLLKRWLNHEKLAVFGALLFAVHPLQVEAVAWVSIRKELLFTFFFLLALVAHELRRVNDELKTGGRTPFTIRHSYPVVFFVFALLSKVTAITLPIILVLRDWREQRSMIWRDQLTTFALAFVFGVIAWIGQQHSVFKLTLWEFVLLSCKSIVFYLKQFLLPTALSALYPAPLPITLSVSAYLLPALVVVVLMTILWRLRRDRDLVFGALFFLITLAPSLLSYMKASEITFAADRYVYLPSLGLIVLVCFGLKRLNTRAVALVLIPLVLFGFVARTRAQLWGSAQKLFADAIEHYPESHVAQNNVGFALLEQNKLEEAQVHIAHALHLHPDYADAHINMAVIRAKQGDLEQSEWHSRRAIELNRHHPMAHFNLAGVHYRREEWAEAERLYRITVELDPYYATGWRQLARTRLKLGDREGAIQAHRTAQSIEPRYSDSNLDLLLE